MKKYISLEQAATAFGIQTIHSYHDCMEMMNYAIAKGWICPYYNVVPVVRCKDCIYRDIDDRGNIWCARNWTRYLVEGNDFCSRGQRKED